jgi:secreted PhoX family phosphatase
MYTYAGNGSNAFGGDGGPATSAALRYPYAVAIDTSGNLYISDGHNHRIRKVYTNGTILTVAGNGSYQFSGDNGPATSAGFNSPAAIAFDTSGNLYFAANFYGYVRKVDANGTITTVAGNGSYGQGGDGGLATNAEISSPFGVAFDTSGNMYISQIMFHVIRKVDANGTIATVACNGSGGYSGDGGLATSATLRKPTGIAFDTSGNLYIAEYGNNDIRKVYTNGTITTTAGKYPGQQYSGDGGPATSAELNNPSGLAFDTSGNMYICDKYNSRVRIVYE